MFIFHRVLLNDWTQLRSNQEPTEFFSISLFHAVFEALTPFQSLNGNRIVIMNCNRIRDDNNHVLVKEYVWQLLKDELSVVEDSSFHAVFFILNLTFLT